MSAVEGLRPTGRLADPAAYARVGDIAGELYSYNRPQLMEMGTKTVADALRYLRVHPAYIANNGLGMPAGAVAMRLEPLIMRREPVDRELFRDALVHYTADYSDGSYTLTANQIFSPLNGFNVEVSNSGKTISVNDRYRDSLAYLAGEFGGAFLDGLKRHDTVMALDGLSSDQRSGYLNGKTIPEMLDLYRGVGPQVSIRTALTLPYGNKETGTTLREYLSDPSSFETSDLYRLQGRLLYMTNPFQVAGMWAAADKFDLHGMSGYSLAHILLARTFQGSYYSSGDFAKLEKDDMRAIFSPEGYNCAWQNADDMADTFTTLYGRQTNAYGIKHSIGLQFAILPESFWQGLDSCNRAYPIAFRDRVASWVDENCVAAVPR